MADNQTLWEITPRLVSIALLAKFEAVVNFGLNSLLCLLGIVTNLLTMVVFAKMGFKETSNITMTAIAFWNFLKCFLMFFYCIHFGMWLLHGSYLFATSYQSLSSLFGKHPANIASFVAGALSAYVAVERCLCVSLPFTVKYLLTRKSVTVTCIAISVFIIGANAILFVDVDIRQIRWDNVSTYLGWGHKSIFMDHPEIKFYLKFFGQMVPIISVGITSLCTAIIIYKLKQSSQFRSGGKRQEDASHQQQLSSRDTKIVRMLLVVVIVYIVCSVPAIALNIPQLLIPNFSEGDYYRDFFYILYNFVTSFSLIDASTNIFIFYYMSSEFHLTLRRLLFRGPVKTNKSAK